MGGKVPKIEILYHNPPSSGRITVRRRAQHPLWGTVWIEREVSQRGGILGSPEAAAHLGITLVWLYKLVKQGKLHPKRRKGRLLFRLRELWRYEQKREPRKSRGSAKEREPAWLIN